MNYRPLPAKLRLYETLYSLNRGFEDTLQSLDHLQRVGLFRPENLNAFKVSLERSRAEANEELIETLQECEQEESAHFDSMEREWQKQHEDPDDVFFAARDRRQEIKQQIKDLQRGLDRMKPRRKRP